VIFGRVSEADPPPAEKYCVTRGVYRMRGWLVAPPLAGGRDQKNGETPLKRAVA